MKVNGPSRGGQWRRPAVTFVALTLMLAASARWQSVTAAMPLCDANSGSTSKFLGNGYSPSGLIGVYSEIENVSESLCTQPTSPKRPSWSLAWVSLDGPNRGGLNIFQGGYATCPPPEVGQCPYNGGNRFIWVYYAHDTSIECGMASNTGFIKIQDATTYGTHFFQVSKVGTQYNFYVDEVYKYGRPLSSIDTCWGGVIAGAEWQDEMLNINDQAGGRVANPQNFGNNQYQTGSGWHDMNRTLNSACDANSNTAHWHCHQSGSVANYFVTWDDRVP